MEVFESEKGKVAPEKAKKLKESVSIMEQSEGIAAPDLEISEFEIEKNSQQKRHRGRKRKLELTEDNADAESTSKRHSTISPKKKRSSKTTDCTGARKTANQSAKRPRRKTMVSKSVSKDELDGNDKLESEAEDIDVSTLSEFLGPLEGGEDDEDTMAASVAPTDADEESVAATTITTEETAPEVLLKPPRPPARLRAPKPKKKK